MNLYLKIYSILNKYRKYVPMLIDAFMVIISYITPYILTGMESDKFAIKYEVIKNSIFIYLAIYIGTFFVLKVYKNMWRYTGIEDIYRCLKASVTANIIFYAVTKLFNVTVFFYVYPFVAAVSTCLTIAVRIFYRSILIIGKSNTNSDLNLKETNVMIIGAGQATSTILSEIKLNNHNNYVVKCIIDDDETKVGRRIHSVPVAGDTTKIVEMAKKYEIEEIIFSIPSIDKKNKKRILDLCADTQCKLKILPEIYSLIDSDGIKDIMGKLRDVQVEDLLGRDPICLDCNITKEYIENKVVLVTGGGGSIGSELCRQVASYSPKNLIILDIYENNAYSIQQELIRTYGDNLNFEVEIASVRDKNKIEQLFASKNIDIVFHAAAHKHVPLMEKNPEEAIKNNIIGTYNTVYMADKYKVDKFVLISTDKAVNPTNIMGATKRICEMIIQSFGKHSETDFVAVRFGNVLGSNGSVIPLFIDQIKAGGPVTVTHEDITRFFMTIPEAVQLVMQASSIAKGGEIFVLDMGEPVKIKDLAYNLIRLSGLVPDKDIEIAYTGLRPGEKLYEELLITENSGQQQTELDKIYIERPIEFNEVELYETIMLLEKAAHRIETDLVIMLLEKLVPTYKRTLNDSSSSEEHNTCEDEDIPEIIDEINLELNEEIKDDEVIGVLKAETA